MGNLISFTMREIVQICIARKIPFRKHFTKMSKGFTSQVFLPLLPTFRISARQVPTNLLHGCKTFPLVPKYKKVTCDIF